MAYFFNNKIEVKEYDTIEFENEFRIEENNSFKILGKHNLYKFDSDYLTDSLVYGIDKEKLIFCFIKNIYYKLSEKYKEIIEIENILKNSLNLFNKM